MAIRIIIQCEQCGQLFPVKPSKALLARHCSKKCQWLNHSIHGGYRPPLEERFWAKVDKTPGQGPSGDCWIWSATRNKDGYGMINVKRRPTRAHILSYTLHFGEIPKGLCVCHTCDIRECVNPAHLWLGTSKENFSDMFAKGRHRVIYGEDNKSAKLTEFQARSILADPRGGSVVAREYGVSPATVCMIRKGLRWPHLTP